MFLLSFFVPSEKYYWLFGWNEKARWVTQRAMYFICYQVTDNPPIKWQGSAWVLYNIQILTASSAMVKTMTPEVIPGAFPWAFHFPEGITEGVIFLTIARVKAVNICFITPQTFLNTVLKLQTWMLQSTDDANTDCKNCHCAACSVVQSEMVTDYLSSSWTQRTSWYCTPCASLRTSARRTDALSHGRRLAKLRHVMWRALNQWAGRILVRGVII